MMPIAAVSRRLALLLILAFTFSAAARADDASHRAKAQEMMTLLQTRHMVEQIAENIKKQIVEAGDSVAGATPTPEQKAKVADFEKQADQIIDAQLGWDVMKANFTDIYVKNFTEEQLDAIIAFYKSPAGIALLANMPTVNTQVTKFGTSQMGTLQPQLKALFEDLRKSASAPPPSLSPVPQNSSPSPSPLPPSLPK